MGLKKFTLHFVLFFSASALAEDLDVSLTLRGELQEFIRASMQVELQTLPQVQIERDEAAFCARAGVNQPTCRAPAIYDRDLQTIFINANSKMPAGVYRNSILLHEWVHFAQDQRQRQEQCNPEVYECCVSIVNSEREAYQVQLNYLYQMKDNLYTSGVSRALSNYDPAKLCTKSL